MRTLTIGKHAVDLCYAHAVLSLLLLPKTLSIDATFVRQRRSKLLRDDVHERRGLLGDSQSIRSNISQHCTKISYSLCSSIDQDSLTWFTPWFFIAVELSQTLYGNSCVLKHSTTLCNNVRRSSTRYDLCWRTPSDRSWALLANQCRIVLDGAYRVQWH